MLKTSLINAIHVWKKGQNNYHYLEHNYDTNWLRGWMIPESVQKGTMKSSSFLYNFHFLPLYQGLRVHLLHQYMISLELLGFSRSLVQHFVKYPLNFDFNLSTYIVRYVVNNSLVWCFVFCIGNCYILMTFSSHFYIWNSYKGGTCWETEPKKSDNFYDNTLTF